MIDLHTHFIPDWDDGPSSIDDSLRMCDKAVRDGVTDVVLTPHLYRATLHGDSIDLLNDRVREFLEAAGSTGLRFHRGAEVFAVHNLVELARAHPEMRLGGASHVLVEFDVHSVPQHVGDLFYRLQLAGFTPVIAHPERNSAFQQRPERLFELVSAGALAQITGQSLEGYWGEEARDAARMFLRHRWVHCVATDAHTVNRRAPELSRGLAAAAAVVGDEMARMLTHDVPKCILEDEPLPDLGDPVPPKRALKVRNPFARLFKRLTAEDTET